MRHNTCARFYLRHSVYSDTGSAYAQLLYDKLALYNMII